MKKENLKNLILELKNAEMWGDRTIHVTTVTKNEATSCMGYLDFRCFCDALIKKYLKVNNP